MLDNKALALSRLASSIIEASVTVDLATSATQLVMGSGNLDADIVFIGEAPGKKEDETGVPFVGASGRFLDLMLDAAGMSRDDVYITNIVKYRPPDNRDPTTAEKAEFLPYLIKQLEIINPRIVITLGRHSMSCFLPDAKIAEAHGRAMKMVVYAKASQMPGAKGVQGAVEYRTEVYEQYSSGETQSATKQSVASDNSVSVTDGEQVIATWLFVPLYHPAAALYNGSRRQELIDDFIAVAKSLTT